MCPARTEGRLQLLNNSNAALALKQLRTRSDWRAPPPTPIFAVGIRLFAAFDRVRAALAPPPLTLFNLFLGFMRSQACPAAALAVCCSSATSCLHLQAARLAAAGDTTSLSTRQVIYTCAVLRVADALAGGPMTAQELAQELGAVCALDHALLPKQGWGWGWVGLPFCVERPWQVSGL